MTYGYPPSPRTILPNLASPTVQPHSLQRVRSSHTTPQMTTMKVETDLPEDAAASASTSSPRTQPSKAPDNPAAGHSFKESIRRQSRFDPMARPGEDEDEDEYGDLGHRHPLRRVAEEGRNVSLPGIKSLLGLAADRPPTPSSSTSIFASASLPSLIPNSPSTSPSTARTSRYSSLASSIDPGPPGWWAEPFDRLSPMQSLPPHLRSYAPDEMEARRRRSDQPGSLRDAEDAARLRWQAQSRNASFPVSSPLPATQGLRNMLHPPPASSTPRQSISGSPLSPGMEHGYPYRSSAGPSAGPSRSASLVGGQLAQSFAELKTTERRRSSPFGEMPPPDQRPPLPPDRRASSALPHPKSLTRPPTPDLATPRRSSLTELIMANSGDDVAIAQGRFNRPHPVSIPMDKPSISEPVITGWAPSVRASSESTQGISLNSDSESATTSRGPRRAPDDESDMRGMEVLAESASRVADVERKRPSEEPDPASPGRAGPSSSAAGPKYSCSFCAKTFSRPSSLRIHTYSHTGERPFACREPGCGRSFSVQSNLKRHAKVHQPGAQAAPPHPGARNQPPGFYSGPHPPHGYHPYSRTSHPGLPRRETMPAGWPGMARGWDADEEDEDVEMEEDELDEEEDI